jgi:uncharacterized integral membrane protein
MAEGELPEGPAGETPEPPRPDLKRGAAPTTEGEAPVYRGTGVSAALMIGTALTILAIILALQNTENTTVEVFRADYEAPLVVVIVAAVVTGVIFDEIVGFFWRRRRRRQLAERAELRRFRRSSAR